MSDGALARLRALQKEAAPKLSPAQRLAALQAEARAAMQHEPAPAPEPESAKPTYGEMVRNQAGRVLSGVSGMTVEPALGLAAMAGEAVEGVAGPTVRALTGMPDPRAFGAAREGVQQAAAGVFAEERENVGAYAEEQGGAARIGLTTLPEAAGSALPFLATGALGAGAAASAALGSGAQTAQMYYEARAKGADDREAIAAALAGAGIGATEALGIGRAMSAMNKATNGALIRRVFSGAAKEGFEEGFQELGQGILTNLAAQGLYDPERGWADGVTDGMIAGALLGAGVGGVVGATQGLQAPQEPAGATQDDVRTEALRRLAPPEQATPGAVTPEMERIQRERGFAPIFGEGGITDPSSGVSASTTPAGEAQGVEQVEQSPAAKSKPAPPEIPARPEGFPLERWGRVRKRLRQETRGLDKDAKDAIWADTLGREVVTWQAEQRVSEDLAAPKAPGALVEWIGPNGERQQGTVRRVTNGRLEVEVELPPQPTMQGEDETLGVKEKRGAKAQTARVIVPAVKAAIVRPSMTGQPVTGQTGSVTPDAERVTADRRQAPPTAAGVAAEPTVQSQAAAPPEAEYPVATGLVDGRRVREETPNLGSIAASLQDYTVLKGVRSIPMAAFETTRPQDLFYAANDLASVRELARDIAESREISPLIVVQDKDGLYVLEGGHRLAALHLLKAKELPAILVRDEESLAEGRPAPEPVIEAEPSVEPTPEAQTPERFQPSAEGQDVPEGALLPPGLEIRIDLQSGRQQARAPLPAAPASSPPQPTVPLGIAAVEDTTSSVEGAEVQAAPLDPRAAGAAAFAAGQPRGVNGDTAFLTSLKGSGLNVKQRQAAKRAYMDGWDAAQAGRIVAPTVEPAVTPPPQGPPVPPTRAEQRIQQRTDRREAEAASGVTAQEVPVASIGIDPARFQFKRDVDEAGVSRKLKDVEKWDPLKADLVTLWEDGDGKIWVADGHHRVELARRLGQERIMGWVLRSSDGVTAEQARATAALKNIAQGTGTAIDAAKVMRDLNWTAEDLKREGVSTTGAISKQALGLKNLGAVVWNQVWSEQLDPAYGAIIGTREPANETIQEQLAELISDAPNQREAQERVELALAEIRGRGDLGGTQIDMFGNAVGGEERLLLKEKAAVIDGIKTELGRNKSAFGSVVRNAGRLLEVGEFNVNKAEDLKDAAARLAQEFRVFVQQKGHPVARIVQGAAERLAAGEQRGVVIGHAIDQLAGLDWNAVARSAFDLEAGARPASAGVSADLREGVEGQPYQSESIATSFAKAGAAQEADDRRWREALGKLPDGAQIGRWTKIAAGEESFWTNGKKTVFDVMPEVGKKKAAKALFDAGLTVPEPAWAPAEQPVATPPQEDAPAKVRSKKPRDRADEARLVRDRLVKAAEGRGFSFEGGEQPRVQKEDVARAVKGTSIDIHLLQTGLLPWVELQQSHSAFPGYLVRLKDGPPPDVQGQPPLAQLPQEDALFGQQERPPAQRTEGAPTRGAQTQLWTGLDDQRGQQSLEDVMDGEGPGVVELFGGAPPMFPQGFFTRRKPAPSVSDPLEALTFNERMLDAVRRIVQDKLIRVRRTQEAVTQRGGKVTEATDVYGKAELFQSKAKERIEHAERRFIEPIKLKAARAKIPVFIEPGTEIAPSAKPPVDLYLMARHAPRRNAVILERSEGEIEAGSGIETETARAIVLAAEAGPNGDTYKAIGQIFDSMNAAARKIGVETGLHSEEEVEAWKAIFGPHYAPLRTDVVGEHEGSGRGFSIPRRKLTKRAEGRESVADSPLTYAIVQHHQAAVYGEKNLVDQAFYNLVRANPAPGYWFTRRADETVKEPPFLTSPDRAVSLKRDGEAYVIELADPLLARAMLNLGADKANGIVRLASKFTRYLSAVNTSYNPEFVLSNFQRDLQTASIHLAGEGGAKLAARIVNPKAIGRSVRAVFQVLRDADATGEYQDTFREMREAGGTVGWFYAPNFAAVKERIAADINKLSRSTNNLYDMVRAIGNFVETANMAVENGVRLSAYKEARAAGASQQEAARLAKNLTVNFEKRGEWGVTMNAFWMFSAAAINGNTRVLSALKKPRVRQIVAGITVLGAMESILNRMLGGVGDDDRENYDKISEHTKRRNWIMMAPPGSVLEDALQFVPGFFKMQTPDGGWHLKVPMPYGYNLFHDIGRQIGDVLHGAKTPGEAGASFMGTVVEVINPFGSESSVAQLIMPTVLDPVVQVDENLDWAGNRVYPDPAYGPPSAKAHEAFESASEYSRNVAEWLNEVSGGNPVEGGVLDVHPDTLDFLVGWATGGAGRFAQNSFKSARALTGDQKLQAWDIPFWRKTVGAPWTGYNADAFYSNLDALAVIEEKAKQGLPLSDEENALGRLAAPGKKLARNVSLARKAGAEHEADSMMIEFNREFLRLRRKPKDQLTTD